MKRDDAIWLVKTGGQVIGPLTLAQVGKLLQEKEISVVDEVSEPCRRWQMLRDTRAFAEILEKIRLASSNKDEVTSSVDGSITGSVTENVTGSFDVEITEDISAFQNQLKEIVYEDIPDSQRTMARVPPGHARFQSAGAVDPNRIRMEAEKSSRWMWWLTIAVFLTVAGMLGAKRFLKNPQSTLSGFSNTASLGLTLFNEGDYAPAIEILKKAHASEPSRKDLWLPLALLLIQVDGQTVEARRLIQRGIDGKSDSHVTLWTAMGLAHMVDGDYSKAQADLQKAGTMDQEYVPFKINAGAVALLNKEYELARRTLFQVINRGTRDGGVVLQYAVASILLFQSSGEKSALNEALRTVNAHQKQAVDFAQELRLAQTYIEFLKGDDTDFAPKFRRILDVDPSQTDDFKRAAIISRAQTDWTQLSLWCKQLNERAGETPESVAFAALCEQKQGRSMAAKTLVEKAINQSPKDPLLQAVYASILRSAGFDGEASVALGRAIELDRRSEYVLPNLLQARFCQEKEDFDCANTYWMKVLEFDSKLPSGKVGMAQVYQSKNSPAEAQRLLQEVASESPAYRPYLRLQRQISSLKKGN